MATTGLDRTSERQVAAAFWGGHGHPRAAGDRGGGHGQGQSSRMKEQQVQRPRGRGGFAGQKQGGEVRRERAVWKQA